MKVQTVDDVLALVLPVLPRATVGHDNDGQLIIYTDKQVVDGERLEDFKQ